MAQAATVHASAVLVGDRAILIRGPSGVGKSRLAFDLILAGRAGQIPPALLVGDDRVHLALRRRAHADILHRCLEPCALFLFTDCVRTKLLNPLGLAARG